MQFHLVKEMDEVIPVALDGTLPTVAQAEAERASASAPESVPHQ